MAEVLKPTVNDQITDSITSLLDGNKFLIFSRIISILSLSLFLSLSLSFFLSLSLKENWTLIEFTGNKS